MYFRMIGPVKTFYGSAPRPDIKWHGEVKRHQDYCARIRTASVLSILREVHMEIGFIGLGKMGLNMDVRNIVRGRLIARRQTVAETNDGNR